MASNEFTTIGAQVPLELRNELFRIAAQHERSASAEVRLALRQHLLQDPGLSSSGPVVEDTEGSGRSAPLLSSASGETP